MQQHQYTQVLILCRLPILLFSGYHCTKIDSEVYQKDKQVTLSINCTELKINLKITRLKNKQIKFYQIKEKLKTKRQDRKYSTKQDKKTDKF